MPNDDTEVQEFDRIQVRLGQALTALRQHRAARSMTPPANLANAITRIMAIEAQLDILDRIGIADISQRLGLLTTAND